MRALMRALQTAAELARAAAAENLLRAKNQRARFSNALPKMFVAAGDARAG